MEIEAKDIVALVTLIGIMILVAIERVAWQDALPVISSIVFFYLGVKTGSRIKKRSSENNRA